GKNVKTVDYQDAGKVIGAVENEDTIIISYEGPHSSYNYRVPKNRVQGFNDPDLLLSIARAELTDYEISDIQDYAAQLRSIKTEQKGGEKEITVPVIEEKLNVSKKIMTDEATIIKEPVTETKTIEVSVMHEEIVIEKRSATAAEGNASTLEKPPSKTTRTLIRVPLIHEVVKIKKEPYVRQEIVIRKKPRTETKTISDFVISEKVDTSSSSNNTIAQTS
ncbi:MAG: YsnF/AvaK domain-containing protein, partial [Nitrososphaeraceae archaeon]|nr:YsnF/AvaK domain-containing protein [Nitrososphaeraceae archaeon]